MELSYKKNFIDFHTHIFPEKLYSAIKNWFATNVRWDFYFKGSSEEAFNFLISIPNLKYFLCFGYAHKPHISRNLNIFYASLKSKSEKAIPLAVIHQDDEDKSKIVEEAFNSGLSGFKIHCQVQRVRPDDERFDIVYQKIMERDGFILFHAGLGPFTNEFVGFRHFNNFLKKYPRLKVVVAHLGAFESENFLKASLDHEHLYLDTSYTFIANPTNMLYAPLELMIKARDKIFFGSDFPGICHSFEDAVSAITNLGFSEEILDKIFFLNAKKFLKL